MAWNIVYSARSDTPIRPNAGLLSLTGNTPTVQTPFLTNFPGTENPINESGTWFNGNTDTGGLWRDMKTTGGKAVGSSLMTGTSDFKDNIAFIKPGFRSFSANQYIQATAYVAAGYTAASAYMAIVRWNGAPGDFNALRDPGGGIGSYTNTPTVPVDGDILYVEIVGQTITVKLNGTTIFTQSVLTDGQNNYSEFTSGQPGMGTWPAGTSHEAELRLRDSYSGGNWTGYEILWGMSGVTTTVDQNKFGWKSFTAGNL